MLVLVLGLIIFLGLHSIRIVADDWRSRQMARMGNRYKSIYSVVAIIGLLLIIWGFGLARQHPVVIYLPPLWLRHLNGLFILVSLIFFAAARVPRNHIKAKFGHPQVLAVKTWSFGHLLATGMLHDLVLFVPFLIWAIVLFIVSRRRDRRDGTVYPAGTLKGDAIAVVIGVVVWALFAFWLHSLLIGVNPLT
ncbi:NnrU family protein [Dyella caseinilytica]|uniref:NnrU family protein n=1 Tax=Dyella caseinilytica TaxID=1849581 RepID=A0ABX7GUH3_9GAMM|nr:NnrU family protein [Dyella caseinilytica]QRN54098.1 NnrU family protein [Dyella caseinilytica]GFZ91558.1 NnrU protein [Dyella caseinilytica]